ncbi:MAG: sulfite exporter TauE/SafE family protein [Chloroflexota bacterium]
MIEFLQSYGPNFSGVVWITAVVAVIIIGISKAGFGGGVGVIATPLLALVLPVAESAALLLPILIGADILTISHYKEQFDREIIKILLPGAIVGIIFGGLFFNLLSEREAIIKIGVGIIAIGFVLYQGTKLLIQKKLESYKPADATGISLGIITGFISTLAHVGGPPYSVYVLPQNLPRNIFVGTTTLFFFIINVLKLIPYSLLGLIQSGNLIAMVFLIPAAFIGVRLGVWMNKRVDQTVFNSVIYLFLLLTGIQLILGRSIIGAISGV